MDCVVRGWGAPHGGKHHGVSQGMGDFCRAWAKEKELQGEKWVLALRWKEVHMHCSERGS